jgi:hypothetical protein
MMCITFSSKVHGYETEYMLFSSSIENYMHIQKQK